MRIQKDKLGDAEKKEAEAEIGRADFLLFLQKLLRGDREIIFWFISSRIRFFCCEKELFFFFLERQFEEKDIFEIK